MQPGTEQVYTPTELNREVRLHLEAGFPRVALEAEVSNLSRPASGHLYFTLKDDGAQVRCALFRSAAARVGLRLENGMQVLARGRISLYEPRGDFQFIVDSVQEAGEGILQRRFEELKRKLEAEGLFDLKRKRPLPPFPHRIAIVTSPRGAAVRDMLQVLERRWPVARVRLYPVLVQGSDAPTDICRALRAANRHRWADLILLGRGGGSLEDLQAFNEESVARAVFDSVTPVVSAVGHETDFSICDFVADLRAPTPTAAAELATPDQAVLKATLERGCRQLERRLRDRLQRDSQGLDHLSHRLQQRHPARRLDEQSSRLADLNRRLRREGLRSLRERGSRLESCGARLRAQHPGRRLPELDARIRSARRNLHHLIRGNLRDRGQRLAELARTLHAISPLEVIGRGYAVLTEASSGSVISDVDQAAPGTRIEARLRDGSLECTVDRQLPRKPGETSRF